MAIRILIADDHSIVREGLKQLLELDGDIVVVGQAGDGYECLSLLNKLKPDVLLLDINMPNLDGLKVLTIMKEEKMEAKVLILTIHNEIFFILEIAVFK